MSKLEDIIKRASQKYYEDGSSELSDPEFDKKLNELKEENPNSPLLTDVGHGYDIDLDTTSGQRLPHKYGYIQGLTKAYKWSELDEEFKGCPLYCAPKMDGMSVVVYYSQDNISLALTRGARDGATGIDVTDKVKHILRKNSCRPTGTQFTGAIRGEIMMSYNNFDTYCNRYPMGLDGKKKPSNPRNTTAGIMNRKDVKSEDLELLDIIFYHVVGFEISDQFNADTYNKLDPFDSMMLLLCDVVGDPRYVVPIMKTTLDEATLDAETQSLRNSLRWSSDPVQQIYPTDGLVFNRSVQWDSETSEVTYVAQAFKFESEIAQMTVQDVEWEMSKTRYAIPTIRMEPTELAGTTVTFATGLNAEFIQKNDIGPGTIVEVEKHGEIIPFVNRVVSTVEGNASMITTCPDCGHVLGWKGVHLHCNNSNCSNAKRQDLLSWVNFLSPLDNFGDKLRMKYLTNLLKNEEDVSVESLMKVLDNTKISDYSVFGTQDKLFIDMLHNLITCKLTWSQILQALNIPRFGEITCDKFGQYPECILEIADKSSDIDSKYLKYLSDLIGYANAQSIVENRYKFYRIKLIPNLSSRIVNVKTECKKGQIAITGSLSVKRSDFEKLCTEFGWSCGELKKSTSFLVTNTPDSKSSKNMKADKFGVTKITEIEFINRYLK